MLINVWGLLCSKMHLACNMLDYKKFEIVLRKGFRETSDLDLDLSSLGFDIGFIIVQ